MPRESLDAPDDLPKQALCHVALGQLEHEVPRMSDQPPAGLEEPLLEARQGPVITPKFFLQRFWRLHALVGLTNVWLAAGSLGRARSCTGARGTGTRRRFIAHEPSASS